MSEVRACCRTPLNTDHREDCDVPTERIAEDLVTDEKIDRQEEEGSFFDFDIPETPEITRGEYLMRVTGGHVRIQITFIPDTK